MNFKRVLDHTATFNFWKPKEVGESVVGKLLPLTMNQNGQILEIEKSDGGLQHVAVSTVLENVAWESYVGKTVKLTFGGLVLSKSGRSYMTFDVDIEA
jgi:hypothetical protein